MAKRQKDRQYNGQKTEGQTMIYKQKDRQYNGQKTEGQTIQWPKEKRTNNDLQTEGQTIQWPKEGQTIQTASDYPFGIFKLSYTCVTVIFTTISEIYYGMSLSMVFKAIFKQ
jgi:hypothetical protein